MGMKTGPPPGTQARQAVCRHWEYSGMKTYKFPVLMELTARWGRAT